MKELMRRLVREEEGQDLIEYALLIALISIVCVLALQALGITVNGIYTQINDAFPGA